MIYTNENWKPSVTYCEPNEVEVQRMNKEEAITLLEKLRTFHNGTYAKSIDVAIEALQAEPKRGEWVGEYKKICSVCGKRDDEFIHGWGEWETYGDSKFCPNCGAKMDGGV